MKVAVHPTQLFEIANLIFTISEDHIEIERETLSEIQNRFKSIIKDFEKPEVTHYSAGYVRNGASSLPFSSMTVVGRFENHLILHFAVSYNKPFFFIIDTSTNKGRNYIDISDAASVLDDDIFMDIEGELTRPKLLDNMFKDVPDINLFVEKFEKVMNEFNNPEAITGRDCFEIDLGDLR